MHVSPWKGLSEEDKKAGFIGKLTLCGKKQCPDQCFWFVGQGHE